MEAEAEAEAIRNSTAPASVLAATGLVGAVSLIGHDAEVARSSVMR